MNCRLRVLFLVFTLLLLTGVVGHILPVQSQLNPGDILVMDRDAGTGFKGGLFRVDPTTGARTLLSDFGVGTPAGVDPFGVAVESSGNILVTDSNAGTGGLGALFRVDPSTGARTILSDFGVGTPTGASPAGVAVVPEQATPTTQTPIPVGGVVMPTSKLELLAPFLALAGLIVAVSAVVAVKKRSKD